jgi:hypothetical protein
MNNLRGRHRAAVRRLGAGQLAWAERQRAPARAWSTCSTRAPATLGSKAPGVRVQMTHATVTLYVA